MRCTSSPDGRRAWSRSRPIRSLAGRTQRFADDLTRLERDLGGRAGVVVYFRWLRWRWYLPSERELAERLRLVTIASVREGAMYGAAD